MSLTAYTGARILADGNWLDGHALLVREQLIDDVVAADAIPDDARVECCDGSIVPGFIDTQVNGGGGRLFNDDPTVATIETIAAAHRKFGTTALLPTLISDDLSVVRRAIDAVDAAIEACIPGIIGIHLEGPFLNSEKRGIHDAGKFRTIDADAIDLLSSLRHGRTLVTLAPELAPPGAIRALTERGVIVAAGHSLATYDDMQRAVGEGLGGVTHLFNAMTQLESRSPGVVGAAIESDLFAGIIVDGHHVHPASLRAAYRAKGAASLMLVTDAMPTVGSDQSMFRLGEREIRIASETLRSADGTLAGSMLDMSAAVRNTVAMLGVGLAEASVMASLTPARFLGIADRQGRIAQGHRADLVLLDEDMQVARCWVGGKDA